MTGDVVAGNFRSLLAGPDFGHIKYLAQALSHEYSAASQNIMDVPFDINGGTTQPCNFDSVDKFLSQIEAGAVVGLEGPAGAGKTHFIEMLAASRAKGIITGAGSDALVIPVTSAGKILSAIDDRIDGSLSALRASFNRYELPILMKNGLISLAIDGFDELSDSRGYDNSWSALRELLRDVGAQGLIILSGRDSFINKDILTELVGKSIDLISAKLHTISVGFPSSEKAVSWLCDQSDEWAGYSRDVEERFEAYSWLRRSFFISQISHMKPDSFLNSEDEPIIALCGAMVSREVDKLGMPSHLSRATGEKIVYSILTEAARTMMDYEIDFVDSSLLEIAVELSCEVHVPGDDNFAKALSARARTLTFLEPAPGTGDRNNRRFPHEKIKAFFYSRYLIDDIPSEAPDPLGLRRSQLVISDLSVFSALIRNSGDEKTEIMRTALHRRMQSGNNGTTLSGNLSALLISCLPDSSTANAENARISYRQIVDAVFPDRPVAQFSSVYINRADARGCNLLHVSFENCEIGEAIVNTETRFGITLPKIHTLVMEGLGENEQRLRDETSIDLELSKLQVTDKCESEIYLSDTLDALVRLMLRGHWVKLSREDKRGKRLLDRSDWPVVRAVLERFNLLEVKNIGAGGKPSEFLHLRDVDQFLSPASASDEVRSAIAEMSSVS